MDFALADDAWLRSGNQPLVPKPRSLRHEMRVANALFGDRFYW
jgi:hypothetical protein